MRCSNRVYSKKTLLVFPFSARYLQLLLMLLLRHRQFILLLPTCYFFEVLLLDFALLVCFLLQAGRIHVDCSQRKCYMRSSEVGQVAFEQLRRAYTRSNKDRGEKERQFEFGGAFRVLPGPLPSQPSWPLLAVSALASSATLIRHHLLASCCLYSSQNKSDTRGTLQLACSSLSRFIFSIFRACSRIFWSCSICNQKLSGRFWCRLCPGERLASCSE